jgi:DNA polymerase III subunit epsilon
MNERSLPGFALDYFAAFDATWTDQTPAGRVRFVVLDTETTGLDPRRDRIITIGAVAVQDGQIVLEDSFEALLQLAYNGPSVTVHGITREEAAEGLTEPEALEAFLGYLRDGVIVGHHIMHDVETLNAGYERNFGFRLRNRHLDTMDLTLNLERDGAFAGRPEFTSFTLDALCAFFGIAGHDRHTAGGDAFLTAQVFLRLLRAAARVGRDSLASVAQAFSQSPEAPEGSGATVIK